MPYAERTEKLFDCIKAHPENKLVYRNQIVEENMRLVAHVVKKYKPYTEDQYQAGCIGLIVAVDSFDHTKGVPFSSYACFCIERELHKMHNYQKDLIENVLADRFIYLDSMLTLPNGDTTSHSDIVPDPISQEELDRILDDYDLSNVFNQIIIPCIDRVSGKTQGQTHKVDMNDWRSMELSLILALADVESQKVRLNYTQMSKKLGISVQNIRNRHLRVIKEIKEDLLRKGYHLE